MEKSLSTSIRYLKGVGPKRAQSFKNAQVETVEDLLYYFPRRYEDRREFSTISGLKEGLFRTIRAEVLARGGKRSFRRRGFSITEIAVGDETGKIFCVWFNQPYLKNYFKVGDILILYGKVERYGNRLQMSAPEFEIISGSADESLNIGRIVPVYTLPAGVSQRTLRKMIKSVIDEYLPQLQDFLPYDIRSRINLMNLAKSIINIHFPEDLTQQQEGYRRLAFEEFFLFQLPVAMRKLKMREKIGIAHRTEGELVDKFLRQLPFQLTQAQEKVIDEIKHDMACPRIMQRLLQGDVGSGKTVVATLACLIAIQGGYQVAFMVPTEILARQHFEKISRQLQGVGRKVKLINIGLLVSSLKKEEKDRIYREAKNGEIGLLIGTHAFLEENVQFKNLGLVVIDEQHKFGVGQRVLLPAKGVNPDVLIMTATPIPRTLAITLYGDLDISVINELPAGRKPVETKWIDGAKRKWLYEFLKEAVAAGRQAYIIYPIIEESFALDLLSAKKMYQELKNNIFKNFSVGLIHGRLKDIEQRKVMSAFTSGKLQILLATTILEVGIDVANATVMVIEHAERFGLAQLHQLRGRIGRGTEQSYCILLSRVISGDAKDRLSAMVKYRDGFFIAEEDLRIRGPGEFFGSRQHGLTGLKIGNPLTQLQLLKLAKEEATRLVGLDVNLAAKQHWLLKEKLVQRFPEYEKLMIVG